MNNVKILRIIIGDYEATFGPNGGQSTITPEMEVFWEKEHTTILKILKNHGTITESDVVEKDYLDLNIYLINDLSFDQGVKLVHLLEEKYDIEEFDFHALYDEWYEEDPSLTIIVKTK